jgi:imidazolonepropionase-like amidohydrolase
MEGQPLTGGADTPSDQALEALIDVINKKTPLRIQARTQFDITTALRLTKEFGLEFTLEEATDAYRCAKELAERKVPVVYGPIFADADGWRATFGETQHARLTTPRTLLDYGIQMALTASDMRDEQGLAAQAMYSMRHGLSYHEALAAVTENPARILGISDRCGTLEPGKSADLVLWTGQPFEMTSRPAAVVIGGQVVVETK